MCQKRAKLKEVHLNFYFIAESMLNPSTFLVFPTNDTLLKQVWILFIRVCNLFAAASSSCYPYIIMYIISIYT